MSFDAFEQKIRSPALKQVAAHWHQVRGVRPMPRWEDIKPAKIAAHLSIIWSYRYDRNADMLVGRLAGDKIERIFGKTFRGAPMSTLYPADQFPAMFAKFRRVVLEPAFHIELGMVFKSLEAYGSGERIAMPTSSDGSTADGIIGATVYETFEPTHTPAEPNRDSWYPVA